MNPSGHTFLVTGGASGLGAACVKRLTAAGANVMVADLAEPAEQTGEHQTRFVKTDVTDESSVRVAVRTAVSAFGSLRGVVNCAGILGASRVVGRDGPHDLALFRKVIEVNLIGTFNVDRIAAEAMSRNEPLEDGERGVIVNTSSVAAWDGQIGQAAYRRIQGGRRLAMSADGQRACPIWNSGCSDCTRRV